MSLNITETSGQSPSPAAPGLDVRTRIVIASLARNQTAFYLAVADALRRRGHPVSFISFHEPSLGEVRGQGFQAFSGFDAAARFKSLSEPEAAAVLERFGLENPQRWISHEKLCYELRNGGALVRKLAAYLEGLTAILGELRGADPVPPVLLQELGGFLSVVAASFAARRNGIRNVFIEPSFFRGRLLFIADSFKAYQPVAGEPGEPDPAMLAYLKETVRDKKIVIPVKDRSHYRTSFAKLFSFRNLGSLLRKASQKYVRGEREEFSHLGGHVRRHLRMARNELLFRRFYQRELPKDVPTVYYPLHVPADVALTVRAPEYLDQLALIDYLARNLPLGCRLLVKEHPATVGAADYGRTAALLRQHDHVTLLHPGINNYDVIAGAAAVVTVNSKAGAEALLLGKPVVALGDSFYRESGLVHRIQSLSELPGALARAVSSPPPDRAAVEAFFQRVWEQSYPGELYSEGAENAGVFTQSLIRYLSAGA